MKLEIIVLLLLIGFMYLVSHTNLADATDNSINQNASLDIENRSTLIPYYGFQGRSSPGGGVFVTGITPGSPAADTGIIEGDVIIKVDSESVNNWVQMKQILMNATVGQILNFTLLRSSLGGMQEADVRLIVGSTLPPKYEEASIYSEPDNINFSSYENTFLSQYIKIDYPASWNITAEDGEFTFSALFEDSNDPFREYLRLVIHPSQEGTIDELIAVKTPLQNLNVTKPHNLTISDNPARGLEYTYSDNTYGEIKAMKVATQVENTSFLFSYRAQASKFDTYWPTIERMIDSFETFKILDYENFNIEMRVRYPSNWNKTEELYSRTLFDKSVPSVLFFPIAQNGSERPSNELRIYSDTSDRLLDKEVDQKVSDYKDELFGYPEFELLEEPINITILSQPFKVLNYSYSNYSGNKINTTEFITKSTDKIYSFIYSADEDDYPKYLPSVYTMIKSFEPFELIEYENFDIGMNFQYPSLWNKTESDTYYHFYSTTYYDDRSVSPICKDASEKAKANSSALVYLFPSLNDSALSVLSICSTHTDLSLSEEIDQIINSYKSEDVKLTGSNKTDPVYSTQAYMVNYSYQYDSTLINNTEILAVDNRGSLYSFLFSAPEDEYIQYLPSIRSIIASARLFEVERYETVFDNFSSGLIFERPDEWTIKQNKSIIDMNLTSFLGSADLRLTVSPISGSLDDRIKNEINEIDYILEKEESNRTIPSTLGNRISFQMINITYHDNNTDYVESIPKTTKAMLLYARYNNNDYAINYTADSNIYGDYLLTVNELIGSIKIMDFQPASDILKSHSQYGFSIIHPKDWLVKDNGSFVYLAESPENQVYVTLAVTPPSNQPFSERASLDAYSLMQTEEGLEARSSNTSSTENGRDFKIEFVSDAANILLYDNETIDGNLYTIVYRAYDTDKYYYYLPTIMKMIESFNVDEDSTKRLLTGFEVAKGPAGIAVNPQTNIVYTANSRSNTVSVINGSNGNVLTDIKVGRTPATIGIDSIFNTVYVTNVDSNSLSIIDGWTNLKIKDINFTEESDPLEVIVNPITHKVYVGDSHSYDVYVIDGTSDTDFTTIETGGLERDLGFGLAVNPFTNKIYAANPSTGNISVIDGNTNNITDTITAFNDQLYGEQPYEIDIDPFTNTAYVSTPYSIHSIDLSTKSIINSKYVDFPVEFNILAVDPFTNTLYVVDGLVDTLHIMNTTSLGYSSDKLVKLDAQPYGVAVNPNTNMVFVTNTLSNTVTMLDGKNNTILHRIKFNINDNPINYTPVPAWNILVNGSKNAYVQCDGKKFSDNDYFLYMSRTNIKCQLQLKAGVWPSLILFTEWSGLYSGQAYWPHPNTNLPIEFNINTPGTLSGSFVDLNTFVKTVGPGLSFIILITVIFIASIPSIRTKIRKERGLLLIDKRSPDGLSKIEIITINATIMVGVLIFLTISEGFNISEQTQISWITASIIFPFAISVIVAVINHERFATHLMVAGFVNLLILTLLIIAMKLPD